MHESILIRDGHIVDHIGLAAPDVEVAINEIEAETGVRPFDLGVFGAQRRAVGRVGTHAFLEILGPAPGNAEPLDPLTQAAMGLPRPQILFWYIAVNDFDAFASHASAAGHPLEMEQTVNRGGYHYRIAGPDGIKNAPVVPWIIQWMAKMPELSNAPAIGTLKAMKLSHPQPDHIRQILDQLDIGAAVTHGSRPAAAFDIQTSRGQLHLP